MVRMRVEEENEEENEGRPLGTIPPFIYFVWSAACGCLLQLTCYRRDILTSFDTGISSDPCSNAFRQHPERRTISGSAVFAIPGSSSQRTHTPV